MTEVAEQLARIERLLADLLGQQSRPPQRWLDIAAAATYTNLGEKSIRLAVESGALPASRTVRGKLLIDRQAIDAWLMGGVGRKIRNGRGSAVRARHRKH